MKAIWQGTLSFGLVNIPVSLYSAVEAQALGFTMLCATCNNPITYKRWCNHCEKEVEWSNIVKGLKIKKDTYFVLTQENLHKLKPTKTDAINIVEFVDPSLIDPIYLEKHYYLAPKKKGEKAYFLFVQALLTSKKIAVGVFVMRDKEHVCVIFPYKDGLLLTTLNYAYEVKSMESLETLKSIPKIQESELKLALKLIELSTKKKFDMHQFKDHFAECLEHVIKKGKGKTKLLPEEKPRKITHDKTLVTALKASLEKPRARHSVARAAKK
jgi:DNA end-binding protein Ku